MIVTIIKSQLICRPSKKIKYYIKLMNWFYYRGHRSISKYYKRKILYKFGCHIMPGIECNPSLNFPHPIGIVIGTGTKFGNNINIYQNVTIGKNISDSVTFDHRLMPTIESHVNVLSGAVIAGKITIGHGSLIAANAVVTKNVPPYSLVVGYNIIKPLPKKYLLQQTPCEKLS